MSNSNDHLSRRAFFSTLAMGAVVSHLSGQTRRENAPLTAQNIPFASASSLAEAIRLKRISSLQAVDACLRRVEQVNPKINALVYNAGEAARESARAADRELAQGRMRGP